MLGPTSKKLKISSESIFVQCGPLASLADFLTQIFSPSLQNGVSPPQAKNLGLLILQTAIFALVYKYVKVVGDMLSSVHSNFMGRFKKIYSFFFLSFLLK
jgi:hypothetical protein